MLRIILIIKDTTEKKVKKRKEQKKPKTIYALLNNKQNARYGCVEKAVVIERRTFFFKDSFGGEREIQKYIVPSSPEYVMIKVANKRRLRETMKIHLENIHDEIAALSYLDMIRASEVDAKPGKENISDFIEALQDVNNYFIVSPFYSKGDMIDILNSKENYRLDEASAKKYFLQICHGLKYLHDNRVVHRDLSPENILVDQENTCKIIDFGMCLFVPSLLEQKGANKENEEGEEKKEEEASGAATMQVSEGGDGNIKAGGKKSYKIKYLVTPQRYRGKHSCMAPEIYNEEAFDPYKIDIYSLGVLLFLLLAGQRLYTNFTDPNYFLLASGHRENLIRQVFEEKKFNISDAVINLLQNMLHFDPKRRYNIEKVLSHPWITNEEGRSDTVDSL